MDKQIRKTIETAYAELVAACKDYDDMKGGWGQPAQCLLARLMAVATKQERQHRSGYKPSDYASPVIVAAKYFAVHSCQKDYRHLAPRAALAHIATLREDHQIGALLGALLAENVVFRGMTPAFQAIDYAKDLV
jgi:hypothetical protein